MKRLTDVQLFLLADGEEEIFDFVIYPSRRLTTTWNRIVWQSLHDQIQASYRVATAERARYEQMARRARERMRRVADAEGVWSRLRDALDVDDRSAAVR